MTWIVVFLTLWMVTSVDLACDISACPDIKKGDHRCNTECMTSYCNYDTSIQLDGSLIKESSDCYENCVTLDDCDPQNLGNGICDASCNTKNCGFDWGDCTCSPGCLDLMLGDGNCDEVCDNWDCDLDNHDCGHCADGCFPNMLGNGICDPECNNEDCSYDYKDCQCADNCLWTDYGNCKSECMTVSCNFDRLDQYPNNWCLNTSLAIFSSYQQIIRKDFSFVVHLESCYTASNYECSTEKAFNFSYCYEECNILECNYANGNCVQDFEQYYCTRPYNATSGCLSCYNNIYIIVTIMSNWECNLVSYWNDGVSLFPDGSLIRVPLIDNSSEKNPHAYFVGPSANSNLSSGNGSFSAQFTSLSYALSKIWHNHSIIYLSKSNYYIEQLPKKLENGPMTSYYTPVVLFEYLASKNIKIKPLDNSIITIQRAKDDNENSFFWFYFANVSYLEFNNIIFDWKNTISSCNDDNYCDYCPIVYSDSNSDTYYNDRDEKINQFLQGEWCSIVKDSNFFSIESSNLVLNNVTFINFRTGFNTIFYAKNESNLTLNNVTFDNIKVYNNDDSAVITWNSIGHLHFENGIVTRLNNGYEIKDLISTKGFLNVAYATSVVLRNVNFIYNFVLEQSTFAANRGALLFLNLFQMLEVDSCIFMYNYCYFGIINIQQQYNDFSIETNNNGEIIYSTLNHIHISNSNFTSNYVKMAGIIYVHHEYESQNLLIENSSFILNGIEAGPLLYIENNYVDEKYLLDIILNATDINGKIVEAKCLAKWVKMKHSTFIENYSGGSGILEAIKMINIDLKDIIIVSNGANSSIPMNANTIILKYYIENPNAYIKLSIADPPDLNCESLSSISNSINLNIESAKIQNNYCKLFSPGIIISNTTNSTIVSSYFENNSGFGINGICIATNGNTLMTIRNSYFISNQNYQVGNSGAISSLSSLLIQNCTFYNNVADLGGALYFAGHSLEIISSYFDSNQSPNLSGGAIYFDHPPESSTSSLFSITQTEFTNNTCALDGGGIYISKSSPLELALSLVIDSTHFYVNKAFSGSSIFIDKNVILSPDSYINNCNFHENKASLSGTISINYIYGILEFYSCSFIKNSGIYSSGFNIGIGENSMEKASKLILNSCKFKFNSGNVIISLDNQNTNSTVDTNLCLFEYNVGSVFSLDNDYLSDKNSIFQHNYSPNSGGVLNLKNAAIFRAENGTYINCSSNLNGGVASISLKSQYFCFYCIYAQNSAKSSGGVIYADSDAEFHIYSSILNKNWCKNRGSAIFMASVLVNSSLDNTTISENYAYSEGTITLLSSLIFINSSKISNNSVSKKNPGIHLENSDAIIVNTLFSDQNGDEGCFILL